MDSSLHHDPFAPEGTTDVTEAIETDFNAARWRRAGAKPLEVAALAESFAVETDEEKAGLNGWMASCSDADLKAWLDSAREQGALALTELTGDETAEKLQPRADALTATLADEDFPKSGKNRKAVEDALDATETALDALRSAGDGETEGTSEEGDSEGESGSENTGDPDGGQEPDLGQK